MSKMKAFLVFLNGEEVDKVFYTGHTAEEVRYALVTREGYNASIRVISEEFFNKLKNEHTK